ncbi:MAG: transglycosylase domain-containing protein [Clostridia bacterium]|nr:transglycosylase domain-containing protein [Clostridia bacterium]
MKKREKQLTIDSFKKEKKSAKGVLSKIGKVIGYFFSAILTFVLVCFITGIIVGCVFAIYVSNNIDPTMDESLLVTATGDQTTKIYYYDFTDRANRIGTAVELEDARIYGAENSLWASYDEIPTYLREAFVSIEDERFWTHNGVDWKRTAGAVLEFVFGNSSYGGSTITQQLIKNVTGNNDATIQRKVQEILCALNLEKSKSKEEIIELYLNIVPLSQGCVGVRSAAKTYFGKELSDLTLTECAALASITKFPTKYDPIQNPDKNLERRTTVLWKMYELGKISDEEYNEALAEELVLVDSSSGEQETVDKNKINSWYIDTVFCDVRDDLMEKYNISSEIASNLINSGGLSIYTLMDPKVQSIMEEVYADESTFPENTGGIPAESAMAVVDPETGDLLGVIGSRSEKRGNLVLNYATQTQRAPGSSLKPLSVYAPALEAGLITYGTVYDDTPLWFDENNNPYPHNLPDVYKGLTTINSAVERSVNTVAMKVLEDLTIDVSYDYLKNKLGFEYLIDYAEDKNGNGYTDKGLAALSLGQLNYGVTVRDIAAAYTVFPNGGIYHESNSYLYVYDSEGNLLLSNDNAGEIVFSEQTSYIMTKMLQNVMNNGTGTSVSLRKTVDVAGKTGTAGNDYDRWFVGYTPYYVGSVWYGYSYPKSLSNLSSNPSNKIFDLVMTRLHEEIIAEAAETGESLRSFDDNRPSDIVQVTYCKDSGKLMTDACRLDPRGSRADTGYFTVSTAPTEYCDTHVIVDYDATTNAYAHEYTLPQNIKKVALIRENTRAFPVQIYVEDAQYVYRDLPIDVRPCGWWGEPYFINAIPEGTYVGTTNLKGGRQFNSFSYENYDFSRFEKAETTAPAETTTAPLDTIPPSGDENTVYEDES